MNRQTFYYHFHDILELTEWICDEDAERAIKENRTYDTWQEGFYALFEMINRDKAFILQILYLIFDYPHKHYTFKYFEV